MFFKPGKAFNLYKKLLAFYPRDFKEQFGESMEQTFNDLCEERNRKGKDLTPGFYLWLFGETFLGVIRENLIEIKRRQFMENVISNQKSWSLLGLILALPLALTFLIEVAGIEPFNEYLRGLTISDGFQLSASGRIFLLTMMLLLPFGLIISLVPLVRNARNGLGMLFNPLSVLISAALFIFMAILVVGFIVDQYPCWMGVPNCD